MIPGLHALRAMIFCAPVLLAGCGGGSTGNDVPLVDFSTADAAATALINGYLDENGDPATGLVRSNSFVQTGSVEYDGAIRGVLDGNRIVGDLSVTVAFGAGDVTGIARNLQNETAGRYSGTLSGSGNVDSTADTILPQMTLVLTGNLSNTSGTQPTALLLDGDFFAHDSNPEGAVAGTVDGTIGTVVLNDGLFAAEN